MVKHQLDIEKLLQWAYRDELPKAELAIAPTASNWPGIQAYAEMGGVSVDTQLRPQRYAFIDQPHEDARTLDKMVMGLSNIGANWKTRPWVLGPLWCYLEEEEYRGPSQINTGVLVRHHAIMGNRPIWDLGPVSLEQVKGENGQPAVKGITKGGRYGMGACCPLRLEPSAVDIGHARWEYIVWHTALQSLCYENWRFKDYMPLRPAAYAQPWNEQGTK